MGVNTKLARHNQQLTAVVQAAHLGLGGALVASPTTGLISFVVELVPRAARANGRKNGNVIIVVSGTIPSTRSVAELARKVARSQKIKCKIYVSRQNVLVPFKGLSSCRQVAAISLTLYSKDFNSIVIMF